MRNDQDIKIDKLMSLRAWSAKNPPEWIEPHLYILAQIARALGALQERKAAHREPNLDNISVMSDGSVRLGGSVPAKERPAEADDIFSFGVTAYEILCFGYPINKDGTFVPVADKNPRVPPRIARLIEECLRRDPAARPSIWLVEAGLMDFLQMSGQLMRVKEWMRTGNPELYSEAFALKHSILKNGIHLEIARGADRGLILAKINQFKALFPGDPALETFVLPEQNSAPIVIAARNPRWVWILALVVLVLGLLAYFMLPATTPPKGPDEDDSLTEAVMMQNPPPMDVEFPANFPE